MRTRLTAVMAFAALTLSATAAVAAERYDPDDALGTDSIDIEVVCPTDGLPAGVDEVVEVDGQDVYVAPAPFAMGDHGGFSTGSISRTGTPDEPFDDTSTMVVDGNAYFAYPSDHDAVSVLFAFTDGVTWTAAATFDANGCIEGFGWTDTEALQAAVEFRAPDGVSAVAGLLDTEVGEPVDLSVVTTNTGPDATLADGWLLGLEVGDFSAASSLEVELCGAAFADCAPVDADDIEVIASDVGPEVIVQIELVPTGDALAPGEVDTQYVRATFGETGQFTGTVFVFGEAA